MAGPGIFVELLEILYQAGSQWIQMDVTNELQEVGVFLAHNGFVPVLEEVACAFVSFVEGHGVSGH